MSPLGQTRTFLLWAARSFPPSADIGPGGQSVGQAAQFCLGRRVASPVTATTDFLAPDILNKCCRAVRHFALCSQRTRKTMGGAHKKKGRLRCHKRPKSREETPEEGSDSGSATAHPS
jgi:hypothetical protein